MGAQLSAKFIQRRDGNLRRGNLKRTAGQPIELPGRHARDDAGLDLDMRDVAGCAPLEQDAPDTLATEWVPAIVNDDILPDMGRMTLRL